MAATKLYGKSLKEYEDIDVDALLSQLTEEELEQLGQDLIDPDDPMVPPSERCAYICKKEATGPFNRKQLLEYLEKRAREEPDREDVKPYKKETRGKVWKPKEQPKASIKVGDDDISETEWDDALKQATEEELVDLAAILGFHGMLNQVQYHKAFVSGDDADADATGKGGSGFQGVAKHEAFKLYPEEPPNTTDVEESLKKLKDNDSSLKELNLNNIKNISLHRLCEIGQALAKNTTLEVLSMANTKSTDRVARAIAESLGMNKTLKTINLESNYISGEGIVSLVEAIGENEGVIELRVTNQRPTIIGCKAEMAIAALVRENKTLLRLGIFMEVPSARIAVQEYLKRNYDNTRRQRVGQELIMPPVEEDKYGIKAKLAAERAKKAEVAKQAAEKAAAFKVETPAKKEEPKKDETTEDSEEDDTSEVEESSEEE